MNLEQFKRKHKLYIWRDDKWLFIVWVYDKPASIIPDDLEPSYGDKITRSWETSQTSVPDALVEYVQHLLRTPVEARSFKQEYGVGCYNDLLTWYEAYK